jgi:predicted RNA-binding Zn-ribbon protein involved in translation (DUF1610 family)
MKGSAMGIDFLDIHFRLEKKLNRKIPRELYGASEKRKPFDISAGELAEALMKLLPPNIAATNARGEILEGNKCLACGQNIRSLKLENYCPQCGTAIEMKSQVWACVRQVLVDALGVKASKISRDSLLIRDLGAS